MVRLYPEHHHERSFSSPRCEKNHHPNTKQFEQFEREQTTERDEKESEESVRERDEKKRHEKHRERGKVRKRKGKEKQERGMDIKGVRTTKGKQMQEEIEDGMRNRKENRNQGSRGKQGEDVD